MLRRQPAASTAKGLGPCAVCAKPGECVFWEQTVCYACYSVWLLEGPPCDAEPDVVRAAAAAWVKRTKAKGAVT